MADFSKEIYNFQRYGTYIYKFDNVGNMIFDSSSVNFNQVYVAFPLQNAVYDISKIKTMYNVEFEEFVPQTSTAEATIVTTGELQQQLASVQQENELLKSQLDDVITQTVTEPTGTDPMAIKQVILELRKAIGQGRVDSDFSDTFPYTAIRKNTT